MISEVEELEGVEVGRENTACNKQQDGRVDEL
jgi:hypothetical protein